MIKNEASMKETSDMKAKLKNLRLRMALIGLCSFAIMFGFTTSSVLAEDDKLNYEEYKKKEAEKIANILLRTL